MGDNNDSTGPINPTQPTITTGMNKLRGYDFWRTVCKSPRFVVAPMVDMSELSWRLISRNHGSDLAYTPMFHSANFAKSAKYRERHFSTCQQDRPLFVQFCGNDPEAILEAAKLVEDRCDAVDINLGCPQNIAKKGHYGSFLQDEWELIEKIIRTLDTNLKIPVTCKIRVFEEAEKTVAYAKMIEKAGCSVLAVHGRLREQKGANTGLADWEKIKMVKDAVSIPVIANGNILYYEDAVKCLEQTGCDAVMSAEANLHNPAVFNPGQYTVWDLWNEYTTICENHVTEISFVKGHAFKVWHHILDFYPEYRSKIGISRTLEELKTVTAELEQLAKKKREDIDALNGESEDLYPIKDDKFRRLPFWIAQPLIRRTPTEEEKKIWSLKDQKNGEAIKRRIEEETKKDPKRVCSEGCEENSS